MRTIVRKIKIECFIQCFINSTIQYLAIKFTLSSNIDIIIKLYIYIGIYDR